MKELLIVLVCLGVVGCASTAVEFKWDEYNETICKKIKVEGKKKFYVFPVYQKKCAIIKKYGWVPKNKIELKGVSVEVDFKNRTAKGGSFLPPIPLKLEN